MNFVASFGINTIAAGIVYELNALVCSLFNQVCQLFSINMTSVVILVKFNTVYDSFHAGKRFFTCLIFSLYCDRATKITAFKCFYSSIFPSFPDFKQLLI
jgi:hypothetical protein